MLNEAPSDVNATPVVSVVIGVHNGGHETEPTLQSILSQEGVDFEVIVVNDGSTDQTPVVLDRLAAGDARLRVVHLQENQGLTRALIAGCELARGEYIARQDVGDLSLPGRLKAQVDFLAQHPHVVLSSCWTRTVGPASEYLGQTCPVDSPPIATRKLLDGTVGVTHHGAVVFRKTAYVKAGGYRQEFYFAQDLDLWYRLLRIGQQAFVPVTRYQVRVTAECLSSRFRPMQLELARIIRQMAQSNIDDKLQADLLLMANQIRPDSIAGKRAGNNVDGKYWIASMLIRRADLRAVGYLVPIVCQRPLFWRAWLGFPRLAIAALHSWAQRMTGISTNEASSGF